MKYDFTNQQYTAFLNPVAVSDTDSLYSSNMGSDPPGSITQSGVSGAYSCAVKANIGDRPMDYISGFPVARMSNRRINVAANISSTETGAYTLNGRINDTPIAVTPTASCFMPTLDQWSDEAFYIGGSTNAGYCSYTTQRDTTPSSVAADSTGIGSTGSTGCLVVYDSAVS
jgi:hypothetical protein